MEPSERTPILCKQGVTGSIPVTSTNILCNSNERPNSAFTEIQRFGEVAITYSQFLFETEGDGKRSLTSGRVTEIFVLRYGKWTNPGWHTDSENESGAYLILGIQFSTNVFSLDSA
jgi:hypothetical protein